jgi:hypothetical protein
MIMATFLMPPLPMLASQETEDELSFVCDNGKIANSHDLIAHLMNVACATCSTSSNINRQKCQLQIVDSLFAKVDAWQSNNDPAGKLCLVPSEQWCWETASDFTRMYVASYINHNQKQVDVRILPPREIDNTHPLHKQVIAFQRGQDILYGSSAWQHVPVESMTLSELVQHSFRRILQTEKN